MTRPFAPLALLVAVGCTTDLEQVSLFVTPDPVVLDDDGDGYTTTTVSIANTGEAPLTLRALTLQPAPAEMSWMIPVDLPSELAPGAVVVARLQGDVGDWTGGDLSVDAVAEQAVLGCGTDTAEVDLSTIVPVTVSRIDPLPTTEPDCDLDDDGYDATSCGGSDCDDSSPDVHPGADELCNGVDDDCNGFVDDGAIDADEGYADLDGDGYGAGVLLQGCDLGDVVATNDDCDDDDGTTNPGAAEVCGGGDEDCDGLTDESGAEGEVASWLDADADGYGDPDTLTEACPDASRVDNGDDCDDTAATTFPGAPEACDGLDNDCDGAVDEDAETVLWALDSDGDGFGDPDAAVRSCASPGADWVRNADDCLDSDDAVFPGADEVCNGVDDDCDEAIDEDPIDGFDAYEDADGDGVGDVLLGSVCALDDGQSAVAGDCDDDEPLVAPGLPELCDGLDNDCNTIVDDNVEDVPWYLDSDGDGWGDDDQVLEDCASPGSDYVLRGGDCDSDDATVNPDADEVCDGVDNDCDTEVDEGVLTYADLDGDGYGDAEQPQAVCDGVDNADDCDDTRDDINPEAEEVCDGVDNDCDGVTDEDGDELAWWLDGDGDGFGAGDVIDSCTSPGRSFVEVAEEDCDDDEPLVSPAAIEQCNGLDDDCNGVIDDGVADQSWTFDGDGDGFGDDDTEVIDCAQPGPDYVLDGGDCDDRRAEVFPQPDEDHAVCDGLDNDCDGAIDEQSPEFEPAVVYPDADGDGVPGDTAVLTDCPEGEATEPGDDCDDDEPLVFPGAPELCDTLDNDCNGLVDDGVTDVDWFLDADADGYGGGVAVVDCARPGDDYVLVDGDCDDDESSINPDADETCDDLDRNCDGDAYAGAVDVSLFFVDADGDTFGDDATAFRACFADDGVSEGGDCDDDDPATFPGADEVCDGADNDCNERIDDDPIDAMDWFIDGDGDGFGLSDIWITACSQPGGTAVDDGDCDDADPTAFPGADEVCDGDDEDCDGEVDEDGAIGEATWFADDDGDGFGAGEGELACAAPSGTVDNDDDCDDLRDTVFPGAEEVCDGLDNDCNGLADDGADGDPWYADTDLDSFGDPASEVFACEQPAGFIADSQDCDDDDPLVNPAAEEVCDGIDNDCDGTVDVGASGGDTWFADTDDDGFGDPDVTVMDCVAPAGFVGDDSDCDDDDPTVNPDADEVCNGIDDDCDEVVDDDAIDRTTWFTDGDGDGFGDDDATIEACEMPTGTVADGGDCDDDDNLTYPGAPELCDGADNNCDGIADDPVWWYRDNDNDGFGDESVAVFAPICAPPAGFVRDDTDCDDFNDATNPGASEVCDGEDNDCDGTADEDAIDQVTWFVDADNDGFGADSSQAMGCEQPAGTTLIGGDCNDGRSDINPGANEDCDAVDEDCNGLVDDGPNVCPCPVEFLDGKAYGFCDIFPSGWEGAQLLCNQFGYDLVSINSEAENDFLVDGMAIHGPGTDWWIGYSDDAVEGSWVWEDGTSGGYENWEPGQPNDFAGQDCAEIDPDGTWNDSDCLFTFQAFICESP
mgnify:FL=1